MTFELSRGVHSELLTRTDVMNLLRALEPTNPRAGFERGWLEALCRVGLAYGIRYDAPAPERSPCMIDGAGR